MAPKRVLTYKERKQNFVSGHNGGEIGEINIVSLTLPAAVFLWSVLQSRINFFEPYAPRGYIADWLINCGSVLFALTVYSGHPLILNALLLLPAFYVYATAPRRPTTSRRPIPSASESTQDAASANPLPIKPFITMYRGSMMVTTCVAILAVDFKIFPRRFAKVENWGTSLMDLGVGSFVFSAGVVSVRPFLKEQLTNRRRGLLSRLIGSFSHSIPLLVLGLIRLASVKGVEYAEHVTEYGVHWNFFFTLGFLPPFVAIFQSLFQLIPSYAALSVILATAYELALDRTRLTEYIITAPRIDLISQNREGIASFVGYLAIFLAGQGIGTFVLARDAAGPRLIATASWMQKVKAYSASVPGKLLGAGLFYTTLFVVANSYYGFGLGVSRRLANLPYVLWIASFNSVQLFVCYVTENVCFPDVYNARNADDEKKAAKKATSRVLHAFNRNGLPIFLLANLLTGLVNLTLPTLDMTPLASMAVLLAYMLALGTVAVVLDSFNISVDLNIRMKSKED